MSHLNKQSYIWLSSIIAILWSPVLLADDPDSMVRITCDGKQKQLAIETFAQEMDFDVPYPREIKPNDATISMRGLMWATESDKGVVTWHNKTIRRTCQIGKHNYVATLSGYKFNENIQGMCGAGSADLSLTVHKNGKLLAKDLLFNNSCASPIVIESIHFEPEASVMVIKIYDINNQSHKELRASTAQPLTMEKLFGEK